MPGFSGSTGVSLKQMQEAIEQSTAVVITSQYTSVLAAINAYRTTKAFPFTIQKNGNSACTDIPSDVSNTCEWNVICSGDAMRITALLTIYTGGGPNRANNGRTFTANIFNGAYIYNFEDIQPMAKSSSPNLPSDTYSAGTTKTVLVGSGWSGRSLLSVVAIGEYPTGFMQDVSVVAGWINGDNLYVAVNNHSNASKTGVLQIRAYYL